MAGQQAQTGWFHGNGALLSFNQRFLKSDMNFIGRNSHHSHNSYCFAAPWEIFASQSHHNGFTHGSDYGFHGGSKHRDIPGTWRRKSLGPFPWREKHICHWNGAWLGLDWIFVSDAGVFLAPRQKCNHDFAMSSFWELLFSPQYVTTFLCCSSPSCKFMWQLGW